MKKYYTGEDCPDCGDELYIDDNGDGRIYDADSVYCDCGFDSSISVYEDGSMCVQYP